MNPTHQNNIYTVSRLNNEVRDLLENEMGMVWLVGEISNLMVPVSGHWYFTLKDAQAQVKCAMFRGNNRTVSFTPANGHQVLVRARLSLYAPRGDYQIIIENMQAEGEGRLKQEFENLKNRLAEEGLFASHLKKSLPSHPQRVGIITSQTGAALHDILNILKRRDPHLPVVIYPTQVQGKDAPFQIAQAIGRANIRKECDVLILGRGGGSLEDLSCFNEEIVARTVAASQIPIVSAVGHEVDVSISDFAADVRAPTPSAAAELVSQDAPFRHQALTQEQTRLFHGINRVRLALKERILALQHQLELKHPKNHLQKQAQQIDELERRLQHGIRQKTQDQQRALSHLNQTLLFSPALKQVAKLQDQFQHAYEKLIHASQKNLHTKKHTLALKIEKLDAVSPLATLARGYSITQKNAPLQVLRSIKDVQSGDVLVTVLRDGKIKSKVL